MSRISRDEALMSDAQNQARRGTCGRLQVGAVISRDGRIISTGYNGPVSGADHCGNDVCDKDKPCTRSVHAEANAIAFAARYGTAIDGCTLHTLYSPCPGCADLLINSGIKEVVYKVEFRDNVGIGKLMLAGVTVRQFS